MITSLFSFLHESIDDGKITNLKKHLKETGSMPYFEDLFTDFGVDGERIATYLILTYSFDSTYVVAGVDWTSTKLGIADLCKVDIEKYSDVITLKSDSVNKAVIYLLTELKGWKYKKLISLREASANLDKLAMEKPDAIAKNAAKNIKDAAIYSIELAKKADELENELKQTTKSMGRLKEVMDLYNDASMEKILKNILKEGK